MIINDIHDIKKSKYFEQKPKNGRAWGKIIWFSFCTKRPLYILRPLTKNVSFYLEMCKKMRILQFLKTTKKYIMEDTRYIFFEDGSHVLRNDAWSVYLTDFIGLVSSEPSEKCENDFCACNKEDYEFFGYDGSDADKKYLEEFKKNNFSEYLCVKDTKKGSYSHSNGCAFGTFDIDGDIEPSLGILDQIENSL